MRGGVGCVRRVGDCVRGCGGRGAIVSLTQLLHVMFRGQSSRLLAQATKGLKMMIANVVHNNFWIFIFLCTFLFFRILNKDHC